MKNLADTSTRQGSVSASIISNLALSKGPNASAMSAATGLAANPKKEQVFKGVDFRTFSFDYQFFPRSEPEAANVLRIIKEFKYHMHPEFKDANNFLYIYPSEFDISYYQNGEENMNLHRHTSCVLQEMTVNYTPNGSFTTFPNGMPTQINVTLGFKELGLLAEFKIDPYTLTRFLQYVILLYTRHVRDHYRPNVPFLSHIVFPQLSPLFLCNANDVLYFTRFRTHRDIKTS
jgi:hypothetical protein